jgi:putative intracellular protease/amidase
MPDSMDRYWKEKEKNQGGCEGLIYPAHTMYTSMDYSVILYEGFETIDAFGPVEVMGKLEKLYGIEYYSEKGGIVKSGQNTGIETLPIREINGGGIILIPGGFGARREIENTGFINALREISEKAQYVHTVCTGSALLAKTGLLKGRRATTNKMSWDWATSSDKEVRWIRKARWVSDGKYYTSSGVSAGIDMALGFVADKHGKDIAQRIAKGIEYIWNVDPDNDPFS